jgi:hypothetical protein
MEDEDDKPSSFHGKLSRFAYVPPSSPSFLPALCRAPDKVARKQNWVQSSERPEGDDRNHGSCATPLADSRKRKGERLGSGSHSPRPKKPKVEYAAPEVYAHLNAVPDNVAEDLDGTHNAYKIIWPLF